MIALSPQVSTHPSSLTHMNPRLFVALVAVLPTVAGASVPLEAALAQCTVDSYSDTGRHFIKENTSPGDKDAAYRNWMLLCMKAKGFSYNPKRCQPAKDGALQASESRCYEKM